MSNDRQYGTLDMIRPDHVKRYLFAANRIQNMRVLDVACGCGYGSWLLHGAGNQVTSVDIEPEAIEYAKKHYQGPTYLNQPAEDTRGEFDALVSFETIEHIRYPASVLQAIGAPLVIASVPNEEAYPFDPAKYVGDKYPHLRHYRPFEFQEMLDSAGYVVQEWYCQQDKLGGEVLPGSDGMFLIAVAKRLP